MLYWLVDAIADRDVRSISLLAVVLLAGMALLGWFIMAK
jgi:hypothetical protein